MNQGKLTDIYSYLRANANLLGARILEQFPALHQFDEAVSPRVEGLAAKAFSRASHRDYGARQTLAGGSNRNGGSRVRHRKDVDLVGWYPRS